MKKNIILLALALCQCASFNLMAQNKKQTEADRVKMEHAQIGIDDSQVKEYKHTDHPDAQWFAHAGLGMFIHWGISSVKEVDLSWPMMGGTQIGWSANKPTQDSVNRFIANGDFFARPNVKKDNSHMTPNQYWALAKDFNPKQCDPDTWVKLAKEAGMTYVVLTTKHHDGFAMWPSKFGNFNTKNYMDGRDIVKEYVTACRKYGLKVGLYYSGPDWHFNKDFQSFLYYGLSKDYKNIPSVDADMHVRTMVKTEAEKQQHYEDVAVYLKGQIEELLTNYGKIDMIWFDGGPDIPKDNIARAHTITMERIRQLQPGIVVSPRFFGYGDYKTFESDKALPKEVQTSWAEFCSTITTSGWGYTKNPMKSTPYVLNLLAACSANNTNFLLNYGPTKDGVFTNEMVNSLHEIATWMKINKVATTGTHALETGEQASVPATANGKHRYLFVMPATPNSTKIPVLPLNDEIVTFKTSLPVQSVNLLGKDIKIKYELNNGIITIHLPAEIRTLNGDVFDVKLK